MNGMLATMTILGLSTVLTTLVFTQMDSWHATWVAWLATDAPEGPGLSGDMLEYLSALPAMVIVGQILVTLAMASPFAVRIGR